MKNEFAAVMSKRSDSDLLEIVTKLRGDYQPEAVLAAEMEIQKRNLSDVQMKNAQDDIQIKEVTHLQKENEPLDAIQRALFIVFFWGVIPWSVASTFKSNGYTRKYKEAWQYMKYGFLGFIGIIVVSILFFLFFVLMLEG
ncbi:MAG: hypothetical protein WC150_04255 [Bacteroidia bacterium]